MNKQKSSNKKGASDLINDASLYLIDQLNIEDTALSSYLIGYRGMNVKESLSNWLKDNWYFEVTVEPNKYLFEISEILHDQLKSNAEKLYLPWMADQW